MDKRQIRVLSFSAGGAALAAVIAFSALQFDNPRSGPREQLPSQLDPQQSLDRTAETGSPMSTVVDGPAIDRMAAEKLGPHPQPGPSEKLAEAKAQLGDAREMLEASRRIREIQRSKGSKAALAAIKQNPQLGEKK